MDLEQTTAWLRLAQQPYPLVRNFLEQLDSITFDQPITELILDFLKRHQCSTNSRQVDKSLNWLQFPNRHIINYVHFPKQLQAISSPPALLYLEGDESLLFSEQLAIVGSRKPTHLGRENTIIFATALADYGLTITSGLALGIDGIAHRATLDSNGKTIAVLGCGHNHCYPQKHRDLFETIKNKGLVVSEFAPDTIVQAYQFPRRNRVISGLSHGVLVIEAAIKSGSLITCKLAADQGREVFAVPGELSNPLSRGCHFLIRNGACLVENATQIVEELGFSVEDPTNTQNQASGSEQGNLCFTETSIKLSKNEVLLLKCVDRNPTSINRIVNRSKMKMTLVLSVLFSLELKNKVTASIDGYVRV